MRKYKGIFFKLMSAFFLSITGSSQSRIISAILPLAPLVRSRSVSIFCITITFIPITNLTSHPSSFVPQLPLPLLSSVYFSCIVKALPLIVSSAVHTKTCSPLDQHIFRIAASFHSVQTPCLGVIKHASLHGTCSKSAFITADLPIIRDFKSPTCCSSTWSCCR